MRNVWDCLPWDFCLGALDLSVGFSFFSLVLECSEILGDPLGSLAAVASLIVEWL